MTSEVTVIIILSISSGRREMSKYEVAARDVVVIKTKMCDLPSRVLRELEKNSFGLGPV